MPPKKGTKNSGQAEARGGGRIRSSSGGRARAVKKSPPAKLIVYVQDFKDNPVNGIKVKATKGGATLEKLTVSTPRHPKYWFKKGILDGVAHFGKRIPPGQYSVALDWWGEDEGQQVQVSPGEKDRDRRHPHLTLRTPVLRMYLNADRRIVPEGNDNIDNQEPANYGEWRWGQGKKGGVILVRTRNWAANDDVLERAEIRFRWDNNQPETHPGWRAVLETDHPDRIRIFPTRKMNAPQLNFDGNGELDLAAAAVQAGPNGQISLWVEAADFGADAVENNWRVALTFTYNTPGDNPVAFPEQSAQLRIAPWIMASDLDPMGDVWFVEAAPRTGMQQQIRNFVSASAQANTRPPSEVAGDKPFLRDVMRCGWVMAPHHQDIVILERLDQQSGNVSLASRVINAGRIGNLALGIPPMVMGPPEDRPGTTAQDGGGNMLVTPPTDRYPFGRIVYGANEPNYRCHASGYFAAQGIQDPLTVQSHWLQVGHVDEFISFVPDATNAHWPYRVLLASPRLGYILAYAAASTKAGEEDLNSLCKLADGVNGLSRAAPENWAAMIQRCEKESNFGPLVHAGGDGLGGAQWGGVAGPGTYESNPDPPQEQNGKIVRWVAGGSYSVRSIDSYLADISGPTHEQMFNIVQPFIDEARRILLAGLVVNEVARNDSDIIEIPVLLAPDMQGMKTDTADSVNMLILGDRCLVPKPFGPVCGNAYIFEHYIQSKLPNATFLNDWEDLHSHDGEIHCGTNQIPRPLPDNRAWWNHEPPQ